jgi:hypothetical protein
LGFTDAHTLWTNRTLRVLSGDDSNDEKIKAIRLLRQLINPYFDYERPTAFSTAEHSETRVQGADTLQESDYSLAAFIKEHSQPNNNICQNLTYFGLLQLKPDELAKLNQQALSVFINQITLGALDDAVFPILKIYFDSGRKLNAGFVLSDNIYTRLTYKQLENLPKSIHEVLTDKVYFASLFKKGWGRELKELSDQPNI